MVLIDSCTVLGLVSGPRGSLAVVPVLVSTLPILLAVLFGVIVAMAGAVASLMKPRVMLQIAKAAWRLKFAIILILVIVAGLGGSVYALNTMLPGRSGIIGDAEAGARVWEKFRGDSTRRGWVDGQPGPTISGVNWMFKPGSARFYSSPAVVGNRLYVASAVLGQFSQSGSIYCLDTDTGAVVWQTTPKNPDYRPTFSSPVVAGEYLLIGEGLHDTTDARIICLSLKPGEEGRVLWTHMTASHVESTPVVWNNRVYANAGDDGIYCLALEPEEAGQAQVLWHLRGDQYRDAETSLLVHDGILYAGLGMGGEAMCIIDAERGEEIKRIDTPYPVFGPPAVANGRLYFGMGTGDYVFTAEERGQKPAGEIWCVDMTTHEVLWKHSLPRNVLGAVAVTDDAIYAGSRDGGLYVISHEGRRLGQRMTSSPIIASPAVTDDLVYVLNVSGMLHAYDRITLEPRWEQAISTGAMCISSPAVARGRIFVGTENDGLLSVGSVQQLDERPLWPAALGGAGRGGNLYDSSLPDFGAYLWPFPKSPDHMPTNTTMKAPVAMVEDQIIVPIASGEAAGLASLPLDASLIETPEPDWILPIKGGVHRSPVIVDETIYVINGSVGESDRHLIAVHRETGRELWRKPVHDDAPGMLVASNRGLLVAANPQRLVRYKLNGQVLWTAEVGRITTDPLTRDGLIVVTVAEDNTLILLDRDTGSVLWRHSLEDMAITAGPMLIQSTIYLGTTQGIVARSLADGEPGAGWTNEGGGVSGAIAMTATSFAYINDEGVLTIKSRDGGAILQQVPGAQPGTTPLPARGAILFAGPENLQRISLDDPDPQPIEWVDLSWLGQMTAPMVIHDSMIYLGIEGYGLVKIGASNE